jgi:DNA invertase Pin-like site-specific DNA recombinase
MYCAAKNYDIISNYADSAVSGKQLHRPKLSALLADLLQHPGCVVVCDTADRLARDALVMLTICAQIEAAGCTLEFADGTQNRTTKEGRLLQTILAGIAQYQREGIAERTTMGLAKKKANGEYLGKPPLGYKVVNKHLVENPQELMAIKRIKEIGALGYTSEYVRSCIVAEFGISPSARTIRKILQNKS